MSRPDQPGTHQSTRSDRKISSSWLVWMIRRLARRIDRFTIEREVSRIATREALRTPSWTSGRELQTLFLLARSCPPGSRIAEIGSHLGASAIYLAAGVREGIVCCVDTWMNDEMPDGPRDTMETFEHNTRHIANRLRIIRKTSVEVTREDLDIPLSLLFIDADHSYEAVVQDFAHFAPWLAPRATVAFHDASNPDYPGVRKAVGEIIGSGDWMIAGVTETMIWIERAGPRNEP